MDIFACLEETGFDQHFSNQGTTITTLLLDQNIITELKNQNPKLLEYLDQHKHQFIWDMIQYTIIMPTEQDTYDRAHRLPYISSELLAIDSDLIYKQFFRQGQDEVENQYWKELLNFLDGEAARNEILMGYFQKVISNLYIGNKQRTTNVVAHNLDRFAKLLPNGSIADILKKCLVLLNENEGVVLEQRKRILHKVMGLIVSQKEEIKAVCADILNEVVNRFQAFSSGDVLVEQLLASESFLSLYQIQNSEAINNFLIVLVKKSQQRTVNQNDESIPLLTIPNSHKVALGKYLAREAENIRKISLSTGFIVNQNKQTVRKSNKSMYALLHLFGLVLPDGYYSFVNEDIITFLWNLVLLYPYNNILHGFVRRIFLGIIQSQEEEVRKCFLSNYETSTLNLAKQHLDLLRPFIYCIWMEAKRHPQVTEDPAILTQFQQMVSTKLKPFLQYEVKHVEKQTNSNHKLIVDEEDAAPKYMVQMLKDEPRHIQEEKLANNSLSFEQLQKQLPSSNQEQKQQIYQKKKQKPKQDFDFFGSFSSHSDKKSEESKKEDKKNMFDNFSDFF